MEQVTVNGASLAYREHGSGEPVVLVHGSASDYRNWLQQENAFDGRYRVINYSRRYHWPNDAIPDGADYSMMEQVDDLEALVESLDARPAHLVGHSYGAFLCLLLAIGKPECVRTLVLAEPPVLTLVTSNPPKPQEILKLLITRPRTGAAVIKFAARGLVPATAAFKRNDDQGGIDAFGRAVFGRERYDALPPDRVEQTLANASSAKAELLGSGFAPLDKNDVRSLRMPILLITGERSVDFFHRLSDRLAELTPHAERVVIPGGSHRMHEENPRDFNAAIMAFLARHSDA